MDERQIDRERRGNSERDRGMHGSAAGPANTPSFGKEGNPGSRHPAGSEPTSETERALEHARDRVAQEAAPIVAEKMQEAVTESAERLQDTMGDEMRNVADAVQHDARRFVGERLENVRHRVEDRANEALDQAADQMHGIAQRVDELGSRLGREGSAGIDEASPGIRGRAGQAAHQAADRMHDAADYLRDHDIRDLEKSLEIQVRQSPIPTLLAAAAVGWVFGKIIR